ncbi:MAG: hypothetical protein KC457_10315, partial [Myxococcales bacterium]|nr:hypothetical protein [Myxococcales bacterium]
VRPSHREGDQAGIVLIERRFDDDGRPQHRVAGRTLTHLGPDWPALAVSVLAGTINLHVGQAVFSQADLFPAQVLAPG